MHQNSFFLGMLSEEGTPSSKRMVMFLLLAVFVICVFVNLFTGKKPDQVFLDQNFYLLTTAMGLVFGANVLNKIAEVKKVQSENNKAVGSPSPAPDNVVVDAQPNEVTKLVKP